MAEGFKVLVIDPPWPMVKIEREVRPNQVGFDYPTMSIAEITDVGARAVASLADDAHVFLWATNKYLPASLKMVKSWELVYVCDFVWHKPGGFQPWNMPQFNHEYVIYAQKGSPVFRDTNFQTCFDAPRGAHSEKPELFYETLRRVIG